jgi:hypothetical protein
MNSPFIDPQEAMQGPRMKSTNVPNQHVGTSSLVPGSLADQVRKDTASSGHGVASDPIFLERQRKTIADDEIHEEDHLLDRCISPDPRSSCTSSHSPGHLNVAQ